MKAGIIGIIVLILAGCEDPTGTTAVGGWTSPTVKVRTVEHEGHRFVVVSSTSSEGGVSVIHHPNCCKPGVER